MCICICICICTYSHTYVCVYIYIYIYIASGGRAGHPASDAPERGHPDARNLHATHARIDACVSHAYIDAYIDACIDARMGNAGIDACVRACVRACMGNACIDACMHACMRAFDSLLFMIVDQELVCIQTSEPAAAVRTSRRRCRNPAALRAQNVVAYII